MPWSGAGGLTVLVGGMGGATGAARPGLGVGQEWQHSC